MKSNYNYQSLYNYVPSYYMNVPTDQQETQHLVWNMKKGICPSFIVDEFVSKLKGLMSTNQGRWLICFIPASSKERTNTRWYNFSVQLQNKLGSIADVRLDAVTLAYDETPGYITGKKINPTENFQYNSSLIHGKNIIIIDDVITRGRAFNDTAMALMQKGANTVQGLFLAETIHPNLPKRDKSAIHSNYYDDELLRDIMEDELMYEELMMNELDDFGILDEVQMTPEQQEIEMGMVDPYSDVYEYYGIDPEDVE